MSPVDDDPLPRIQADTAKAMKAGDKARVGTLRMIASDLKKVAIDTGVLVVRGEAALAVLRRAVKTRTESAEIYAKAGRADLAAQERAEIAVIEEYLPKAASESQIREVAASVIAEKGLKGPAGTGVAIKETIARLGGAADGKTVAKIAAELLRGS
jgi:uncharacterized protein YqeY